MLKLSLRSQSVYVVEIQNIYIDKPVIGFQSLIPFNYAVPRMNKVSRKINR